MSATERREQVREAIQAVVKEGYRGLGRTHAHAVAECLYHEIEHVYEAKVAKEKESVDAWNKLNAPKRPMPTYAEMMTKKKMGYPHSVDREKVLIQAIVEVMANIDTYLTRHIGRLTPPTPKGKIHHPLPLSK